VNVLASDALDPSAIERLRAAGHETIEQPGVQGAELVAALQGCAGLLIRGGTRVSGEVLRGAPSLRVVVRAGTGLDNVDLAVARQLGVSVFNTPAANSVSVAELVIGLLIAFERHIAPAAAALAAGRWEKSKWAGRELSGRTLGLIGFGRIGREVAARARAFDLGVVAHDPLLPRWPATFEWVRRLTLDQLLAEADIVSLHVPLTPGTRGLIGATELSRMKPDAVLVNAARGGLVDEAALAEALRAGSPRGAVLDVFAQEPPGASPLLALPNVLAVPHLGASTAEAQRRAGDEAVSLMIEALGALEG
jgi:D-3-phosphoglycerate dehydrogenase